MREQLDELEKMLPDFPGDAVLLPVNAGKNGKDSEKKALAVMAEGSYSFPFYLDRDGILAFNVSTFPRTMVFDGAGGLVMQFTGFCPAEVILEAVGTASRAGASADGEG